MDRCPSRFQLVQWKVGELDAKTNESLRRHVQHCNACQKVATEIERNQVQYQSNQSHHLSLLRARLSTEHVSDPLPRFWIRFAIGLGSVATICVLLLLLMPGSFQTLKDQHPSDSIKFKGKMSFEVIAKRGQRQFRVTEGAELMSNDALRFVVTVSNAGYLSVFSIDAQNRVSAFYPDTDARTDHRPLQLKKKGRYELPGSIILDQTKGDECLVVAFSENPFRRAEVQQRAKRASWYQHKIVPSESDADPVVQLGVIWVKKIQ